MTIEINGLPLPNVLSQGAGGSAEVAQSTEKDSKVAGQIPAATDKVSLTDTAQKLKDLADRVSELPVVDTKRVESIKQAIADGAYEVDGGRVAQKMMSLENAIGDMR